MDDLDEKELSKIDNRSDGEVEVIDVKLNNRKTKKSLETKNTIKNKKIYELITKNITSKINNQNLFNEKKNIKIKE